MRGRLGSDSTPAATAWWTDLMGSAPKSTIIGIMRTLAEVDVTDDLENIRCPSLIITTTGSQLGSVEAVRAWQRLVLRSELVTLASDSYHIAASRPDECAGIVRGFIDKASAEAQNVMAHVGFRGGDRWG